MTIVVELISRRSNTKCSERTRHVNDGDVGFTGNDGRHNTVQYLHIMQIKADVIKNPSKIIQ